MIQYSSRWAEKPGLFLSCLTSARQFSNKAHPITASLIQIQQHFGTHLSHARRPPPYLLAELFYKEQRLHAWYVAVPPNFYSLCNLIAALVMNTAQGIGRIGSLVYFDKSLLVLVMPEADETDCEFPSPLSSKSICVIGSMPQLGNSIKSIAICPSSLIKLQSVNEIVKKQKRTTEMKRQWKRKQLK